MDTNENDVNIVCISNGNENIFENTLTNFKNKLPVTFEWKKNGEFRYHVALDSVGFSTNFVTTILPDKPGIPSLITARQFKPSEHDVNLFKKKPKLIDPPHSDCVALNSLPDACNTTLLDAETKWYVNANATYKYHFLEDELFNTKRFIEFFKNVVQHSEKTLDIEIDLDNQYINLKSIAKFKTHGEDRMDSINIPTFLFLHHTLAESIEVTTIPVRPNELQDKYIWYKYYENMYNTKAVIEGEVYDKYYLHKGFQHLRLSLLKVNKKKVPNIIKLQFDGIRDQIFNSKTSRDLICFHPNLEHKEKDSYFFHEVERKTFYPLENTTLDTVNFKLVDEQDQPIRLKTGIATVVKLQLRKMSYFKKSFSVRLTSEKCTLHPENTNSNFTVELPETLFFNKKWRVSVNTINLPNYFNSFPPGQVISVIYTKTTGTKEDKIKGAISLPDQVFKKSELLEYINAKFKNYFTSKEPIISFEENIKQGDYVPTCVIKVYKPNGFVTLTKDLVQLLGYGAEDFIEYKGSFYKMWKVTNLNSEGYYEIRMSNPINMEYFAPSYIMLYSNIVAPTIIGGTYTNILKIFPIITSNDDYVIHQFKNPEYHTLLNNEIKNINLQFRTHSGDFIYFSSKEMIIVDLTFSNFE
jgi:hypothetical protein